MLYELLTRNVDSDVTYILYKIYKGSLAVTLIDAITKHFSVPADLAAAVIAWLMDRYVKPRTGGALNKYVIKPLIAALWENATDAIVEVAAEPIMKSIEQMVPAVVR